MWFKTGTLKVTALEAEVYLEGKDKSRLWNGFKNGILHISNAKQVLSMANAGLVPMAVSSSSAKCKKDLSSQMSGFFPS